MLFADDAVQPFLRSFVTWKALLFGSKSGCVIAAATIDDACGMFDVQHFMKQDVFNEPFRHVARIQGLADGNCLVRGIMMAENAARPAARPCEHGPRNFSIKVT